VPVIPKASSLERLSENFNVKNVELSEEDMDVLDTLTTKVEGVKETKFCWNPAVVV
jgi:diketogulonate reductase-like aldo/keto reductase